MRGIPSQRVLHRDKLISRVEDLIEIGRDAERREGAVYGRQEARRDFHILPVVALPSTDQIRKQ